ncbi:T9SS type A sorting domain-containing protein [Hymenobacter sp.]|uniref:T9SS type A sorting domain-containing protein n=1 Tax=Hymenobacter sp. TaxID=1898978 RepID=UPI00286C6B9D|nr:T9SS type A sorting domain-containing protein [Hymenobacter sp.]
MQTLTFTQKLNFSSWLRFVFPMLIMLLGSQSARAQNVVATNNAVTLTQQPTGNPSVAGLNYAGRYDDSPFTTYSKLGDTRTNPVTPPPFLGTYDLDGNSQLRLTKATAVEFIISNNTIIDDVALQYRVYLSGSTQLPNYTSVPLASIGSDTYEAAGLDLNLIGGLVNGGTYTLEVRYITVATRAGTTRTFIEPSGTPAYTAVFSLSPPTNTPPGGVTNWISNGNAARGEDANWFNGANWSNGVPNRFSDVFIPDKSPGTPPTITPVLDSRLVTYEARNLTIAAPTNSERGLIRLLSATLKIYGDLANGSSGLLAVTESATNGNSTVIFAGGNQRIDQGRIANVIIEGTGIKSLTGSLEIASSLVFSPGVSASLRTSSVNGNGDLEIQTTKPLEVNVNLGTTGSVSGETNTALVLGVLRATRETVQGVTETFGNIGVDITIFGRSDAGTGLITRITNDRFFGPINTAAVSIKRYYNVSINNQANLNATVVFHYLDSTDNNNGAIDELNGNVESRLIMFRTNNNGVPFQPLYGVVNTANNTVTQTGIPTINTITLADRDRPLPVTLTSFDAKRVGADALVTWQTASELNNKGFNVQVSTDGKEYRTLGFVASASPNSVRATNYSYTDTEKNKAGVRYYRLMQVDVDGKTTFFSPRAVSFEGKVASEGVTAVAYPNPFTNSNEVRLSLRSEVEGQGVVRITDMTGRTIGQRQIALGTGNNDVELPRLGDLQAGIYMVRVTLPTGETQNLKVVKQ